MSSRLDELPLLEPNSRAEWRQWLAANHQSSAGVWLAVGKKGGTRTSLRYDDAVEEALCFGWIDSTVRKLDADRFRGLYTPRRPGSNWSPSNKARIERLTSAGLMMPAGLAAVATAKANGSWTLLDEIEALVIPDDLELALAATPNAADGFAALPQSQRKIALYWIATAKRPETRARRIAETIAAAADGRPVRE